MRSPLRQREHRRIRERLSGETGAFDLPSILVGVVVVGILTAGILAAIFGVIPWTQDRAAKQDLAAINTAQGVTYAKDRQKYKDLSGLEDAGLLSGIEAEATTVTTNADGKGFEATVVAGNGTKWMITHDDPTPREVGDNEAPAKDGWASARCTPGVVTGFQALMTWYGHPGVVEVAKMVNGRPYQEPLLKEFGAAEESLWGATLRDLSDSDLNTLSSLNAPALFATPPPLESLGSNGWSQWHEDALGVQESHISQFCKGDPIS